MIDIGRGVALPMVALGTGSGQHGPVANATRLWLRNSSGVAIDTSLDYKDERAVAAGVRASGVGRGDVFLETKITTGRPTLKIVEAILQLRTSYVDLMLIHYPGTKLANAEAWAALEVALRLNRTSAIGVSNFSPQQLDALLETATVTPAVNQLELSVSYHDDAALAYNKELGILVQAYSPLCGGFNGSSCTARGGKNVLSLPEVKAVAQRYGVSPAQVALRWIVQQGYPLATSAWELPYMLEDLNLWSFSLDGAAMQSLSNVYKPESWAVA
jgi:diketogulonate reductase-like aldo/keto reductase